MSDEIEELIDELTTGTWQAQEVPPSVLLGSKRKRRRSTVLIMAAVALLGAGVVGLGGFWLGTRSTEDPSAAPSRAISEPEDEDEDGSAEPSTSVTTTAARPESTVLNTTTEVVFPVIQPTEDNPEGAVRYTVYSGGKIYMRGFVRSTEEAEAIVASIEAAVGPDVVVNELEVNQATPDMVETPVYFEDAILFNLGSANIQPEFQGLLNLVPLFLNPVAGFELTVVAKTDAAGSEEYNLGLAMDRADAIVDYLVGIGVDPSLLDTDPRGEADAFETSDPQEAAQQRRVEFLFTPVAG